jgi:hypothetical protein
MNLLVSIALLASSWISVAGGAWTPPDDAVEDASGRLRQFVAQQAAARHRQLPKWSSYTFQYQGQQADGKQFILINAFCVKPEPNVRTQMYFVDDGGPCFFNVKYNPVTKQFFELQINGFA